MIKRLQSSEGFEQVAGYARAVRHGDYVSVSGTHPNVGDSAQLSAMSTYEQTRMALQQAVAAAQELGASKERVTRTRMYLSPDADWREMSVAHREMLGDFPPTNTTVYVGALIPEGALVEVELEAVAGAE